MLGGEKGGGRLHSDPSSTSMVTDAKWVVLREGATHLAKGGREAVPLATTSHRILCSESVACQCHPCTSDPVGAVAPSVPAGTKRQDDLICEALRGVQWRSVYRKTCHQRRVFACHANNGDFKRGNGKSLGLRLTLRRTSLEIHAMSTGRFRPELEVIPPQSRTPSVLV